MSHDPRVIRPCIQVGKIVRGDDLPGKLARIQRKIVTSYLIPKILTAGSYCLDRRNASLIILEFHPAGRILDLDIADKRLIRLCFKYAISRYQDCLLYFSHFFIFFVFFFLLDHYSPNESVTRTNDQQLLLSPTLRLSFRLACKIK